ncbi:hypothetical protein OAQ84_01365 [Bdellovibrionales bacterium]|nr:hypothetical protein [Bdellovibrionales bacterium]
MCHLDLRPYKPVGKIKTTRSMTAVLVAISTSLLFSIPISLAEESDRLYMCSRNKIQDVTDKVKPDTLLYLATFQKFVSQKKGCSQKTALDLSIGEISEIVVSEVLNSEEELVKALSREINLIEDGPNNPHNPSALFTDKKGVTKESEGVFYLSFDPDSEAIGVKYIYNFRN